ncbi:hypothetical protein [Oricola thermophila]|uniref:Glycosyltransferase family 39 protein n=1 Tax=Oricola thermophila TaxID=2742145 RepID=A0A6N1VFZ9_9HYPH|nr:hypothetical protein [Oricola thermophila]QKV17897.1 hypothetical protein HTY61_05185 [Oricola thermophila]
MNAPARWSTVVAAFLAALWLPASLGMTPDASWLLTVAERTLDGEILYRDILEYNPPFSVWIYTGPAFASALTGLSSESFLHLQFALVFWLSFVLSALILRAGGRLRPTEWRIMALAWVLMFVLFPLQTFLQREHFAIMALMPWLALQAARWEKVGRFRASPWMIVAGGVSCSLIVLNKPYYVLTVVVPVAAMALHQRSLRPFFHVENLIGGAIALAYGAYVLRFHADYFGLLNETLRTVYLPVRTPEADILFRACAAAIVVALAAWRTPAHWPAETVMLTLSAIGHLAGTVVMGKTFTYHALPAMVMLGFAFLALVADDCRRNDDKPARGTPRPFFKAFAVFLVGSAFTLTSMVFLRGEASDPHLLAYLRDRHPGASYVSISPSYADSHPLVRLAGGSYVGPNAAMPAQSYGDILMARRPDMSAADRARIRVEIDKERRAFADAITSRQPDIVLVSERFTRGENPAWTAIASTDAIGELYQQETRIGDIRILVRKPAAPSGDAS